jgi:FkbM family methyltransferase
VIQSGALSLYRLGKHSGVFSTSLGRSIFERAYSLYKTTFEAPYVEELQKWVRPGTMVVDVGAFIGFFSHRFAQWVSGSGRVLALEPEPDNFARLKVKMEKAGLTAVVDLVQAAADDSSGERRLEINEVCPVDHKLSGQGIPVTATTIDDLLAARGWPPVSLIKIDVQGAEARVIEGAYRTIASFHPTLFIEVSDATLRVYGSCAEKLLLTLMEMGYTIHRLQRERCSDAMTVQQALRWQQVSGYADLLFLHNDVVR